MDFFPWAGGSYYCKDVLHPKLSLLVIDQDKTVEALQNQPIWVLNLLSWLEHIENHPPDLEKKVKQIQEVLDELPPSCLDIVQGITNDQYKSQALAEVAPYLPHEFLSWALEVVKEIKDEKYRVEALGAIAPRLSGEMLQQALEIAQNTKDKGYFQALALALIAPYLPPQQCQQVLQQALAITHDIGNELDKARALAAIVPHLPAEQCQELLLQSLKIAENVTTNSYRTVEILSAIAPHLSVELLQQALAIAQNIKEFGFNKYQALAAIVPRLSIELLQQALEVAQNENDVFLDRSQALAEITPYLPPQQALAIIHNTEWGNIHKAKVLVAIVPHLSMELLQQALKVAQDSDSSDYKVRALVAIAPHLPLKQRQGLLQQALEIIYRVGGSWQDNNLSEVLAVIIPYLPTELLPKALEIAQTLEHKDYPYGALAISNPYLALEIAQNRESTYDKSEALAEIAPHLPMELLQQALTVAQNLDKYGEKFKSCKDKTLAVIAPHLPISLALAVAQSIDDETYKGKALAAIVSHLPIQLPPQALEIIQNIKPDKILVKIVPHLPSLQALTVVQSINSLDQDEALTTIAPQLAPNWLPKALEVAQSTMIGETLIEFLVSIAPRLSPKKRQEVLQQALIISLEHRTPSLDDLVDLRTCELQSKVLAVVSVHLPPQQRQEVLQQALDIAQNIKNHYVQVKALAAIAPYLIPQQRQEVLQQALEIAEKHLQDMFGPNQSEALLIIASHLPPQQALKVADSIQEQSLKEMALTAIVPHLPPQQALTIVQNLKGYKDKAEALGAIAPHLSYELLQQALAIAQDINYEDEKVNALIAIIPYFSPQQRQGVLQETLEVIHNVSDYRKAKALGAIAPHLSYKLLQQALAIAQNGGAESLASIAPYLSHKLLQQALEVAKNHEHQKGEALTAIAAYLSHDLLSEFLEAISRIDNREERIKAFTSVLCCRSIEEVLLYCPSNQFSTLLDGVTQLQTTSQKAQLLSAIVPRLSTGLFPRVLEIIKTEIIHPLYQAEVLGNCAPYLDPEQLTEALELASEYIPGVSHSISAYCYLIPYLLVPDLLKIFNQVIQNKTPLELQLTVFQAIANRLQDFPKQLEGQPLFQKILSFVSKRYQPETASTSKKNTQILPDFNSEKLQNLLITVAPNLIYSDHLKKLLELLSFLPSEYKKAQILAAIASSPHLETTDLEPFQKLAEDLKFDISKAVALSAFISRTPALYSSLKKLRDGQDTALMENTSIAIALAKRIAPRPRQINQQDVLTLDQAYALRCIRLQKHDYQKAALLSQIAPYLLPNQVLDAQSISQDLQDPYLRSRSLLELATYCIEVSTEALAQIASLQNQDPIQHIEFLSQYSVIVPEQIPTLLKTIEDWSNNNLFLEDSSNEHDPHTFKRRQILLALKPHLPIRLVREIERQTGIGKAPQDLWERVLFVLRNEYRQALKSGSLRNDATQDEDLLDLKEEINALTEMLLMRDLEPPMAVGILGGWGGGKSYIMHLIQTHMVEIRSQGLDSIEPWGLKDEDSTTPDESRVGRFVGHIYQIKFDAWTYSKANLWASLMQTIFFELDRQITLEQQLQQSLERAEITPLASQSGAIWKALYETSDEDRQWFLETALKKLDPRALETWEEQLKSQAHSDQLWNLFASEQSKGLNDLQRTEAQLEKQQKKLYKAYNQVVQETTQEEIFSAVGNVILLQLTRRFGESFTNNLQKELIQKFQTTTEEFRETKNQLEQWHDSIKKDIESTLEAEHEKVDYAFMRKFVLDNWVLITLCVVLLLLVTLIPFRLAEMGASILIQAFAGLTPLIAAIPVLQGLIKKGEVLYSEARLSISEFKFQLEQGIQNKLENNRNIKHLNHEFELLERELEIQKAALPANLYGSIAGFVRNRLEQGEYQNHLGLMHQVKKDLAMLSKRLLPPSQSTQAKELDAKLPQLKDVFPRGPARVVLYVDDLDRCPPDTVVEVLEAVQLLVKNPLFIAVLAIDERYINRALAKHYKGVLSLQGRPSASDYLEKIIQIPYRIRSIHEQALRNYLRAQIVVQDSETSGTKFNEFSPQEFNLLVQCCQEVELSPRSLKRLTNVYKLYKVLSRTRGHRPSRREQKAILSLLAFSSRYPDLMRDIIEDISSHYEERQHLAEKDGEAKTLVNVMNTYLYKYERLHSESTLLQDVQKLRHDINKLVEPDLRLQEIRQIFDFVRSFSFVGDIGIEHTTP